MASLRVLRLKSNHIRPHRTMSRSYASTTALPPPSPKTSPFAPRHFLSIADLTPTELTSLVLNAARHKTALKSGLPPSHHLSTGLAGQTIALMFNKRSTRTRISTEGAVVRLGGHPMFLGKDDIQLGVNETLYDTSVVVSSMVSGIVARVGKHQDILDLAQHSTAPVINALSDSYHPMQTVADLLTIAEASVGPETLCNMTSGKDLLGLQGKKIAWVGDLNNVFYDLSLGALKQGMVVSAAAPEGYDDTTVVSENWKKLSPGATAPEILADPFIAVKNADFIVTDTWISMGQEEEKAKRLQAFEGYQVTGEMAAKGGAKPGWKFLHCLPRHQEEVSDEVFYHQEKSLVFPEAENRLWAALATLEAFVVRKGKISLG